MTPLPPITDALRKQAKDMGITEFQLHDYFMKKFNNEYHNEPNPKKTLDFYLIDKFNELETRINKAL